MFVTASLSSTGRPRVVAVLASLIGADS